MTSKTGRSMSIGNKRQRLWRRSLADRRNSISEVGSRLVALGTTHLGPHRRTKKIWIRAPFSGWGRRWSEPGEAEGSHSRRFWLDGRGPPISRSGIGHERVRMMTVGPRMHVRVAPWPNFVAGATRVMRASSAVRARWCTGYAWA